MVDSGIYFRPVKRTPLEAALNTGITTLGEKPESDSRTAGRNLDVLLLDKQHQAKMDKVNEQAFYQRGSSTEMLHARHEKRVTVHVFVSYQMMESFVAKVLSKHKMLREVKTYKH